MSNYKLINPRLEGSLTTTFEGKTQLEAAETAWNTLSKYVTNNVPQFAFTLENTKNNQLTHFLVKETLVGGGSVKWNISELNLNLKTSVINQFKQNVDNAEMSGGRRHKSKHSDDDDSSSSTSSSEIFSALKLHKNRLTTYPITYWWYDPWVYNLNSVYIPTFVYPMNPYIEVTTINYYP